MRENYSCCDACLDLCKAVGGEGGFEFLIDNKFFRGAKYLFWVEVFRLIHPVCR